MKNAIPVFHGRTPAKPTRRASRRRGLGGLARRGGVALLLASALVACGRSEKAAPTQNAAPKTVVDFFPIKVGDKVVRMQLAVHSAETERGLMGRRDLGRDEGMIFIFEKPRQLSFWMRNTPTPLDIGYFSREGVLEEVYPLHPFDENSVPSRSQELQFALEVNQGWYRENGVKPGARIDMKALAAALQARGFDPKKYGL